MGIKSCEIDLFLDDECTELGILTLEISNTPENSKVSNAKGYLCMECAKKIAHVLQGGPQ